LYLIANVSNNEIVIEDLGITLFPKQAIDLHKISTKVSPENSSNLKQAIQKKAIKVLMIKDEINKNLIVEAAPTGVNKDEMMNELKSFLKEEISKNLQNISQPQTDNSEKFDKLIKMMEGMSNNSGKNKNIPEKEVEETVEVDEAKIANIHTRAMQKITQNAQGSISYSEEKVTDNNLNDDLSKLENLL